MTKKKREATPDTYREIFDFFDAPVTQVDCGKKCASLNEGAPVCCDTRNAIPIMHIAEWRHLKQRSDLWRGFKPFDSTSRKISDELHSSCKAVECKGALNCERDSRSLACRTFPFFPYFTKAGEILGLSHYWNFEDRCWMISNMAMVEQSFIDQFLKAYEILFEADPGERQVFVDHSASMRRVFSRWKRPIPVIGHDRQFYLVQPKDARILTVSAEDLPTLAAFAPDVQ